MRPFSKLIGVATLAVASAIASVPWHGVQGTIEEIMAGSVAGNPPPVLPYAPPKIVTFIARSSNPAVVGLKFTVTFTLNGKTTVETQSGDITQYGWAAVWFLNHDTDEVVSLVVEERLAGQSERF